MKPFAALPAHSGKYPEKNTNHLVPFEFGQHISKNVPYCELHILEGEGHLFPYKHMTRIFDTADAEMEKVKIYNQERCLHITNHSNGHLADAYELTR